MPPKRVRCAPAVCRLFLIAIFLLIDGAPALAAESAEGSHIGELLPLWSIVPFIGILLSIALFPLALPRWWHRHFPKVAAFWAALLAIPFLLTYGGGGLHEILHVYFLEYVPFIILLWSLFTIAGGVHLRGTLQGSPLVNTMMLVFGTIIASWVGTTGASMILIRPMLRANAWRQRKVHVIIFFIFLVSNIGGSLTPLGDPPLFLGFLLGVPFFWTMKLFPGMAFVSVPLLIIFYFLDRRYYRGEKPPEKVDVVPLKVEGAHNIFFLLGVVAAVFVSGVWHPGHLTIFGIHIPIESIARECFLVLMGALCLVTTAKAVRDANEFTWFPIKEVAYLFAGIFMTIVPALAILNAGEKGALAPIIHALHSPRHYFWITGALSSFLDNAPSYLTLFNSLLGRFHAGMPSAESVPLLLDTHALYVEGIALGAVFLGAMTYIGNAPNFMVRSIAEEAGVRMPSFFGYMIKYSLPILLPLFIIMTLVLF